MPICKRAGFDYVQSRNKTETFHDNEEVFYCDITKEIFRDYDDYFRHVMLINSTVWQCETTGRDNLTYVEARRSERRARQKMEQFKDALRPPTMLIIDQAKQSSLNALCMIASKFLRRRFFLHEEVTACYKSTKYNGYVVIEIKPPPKMPTPLNGVYEDTDQLKYKLRRVDIPTNEVVVPFESIRRQRFELTSENLQMFIKNNMIRVDGIIRPKPESYKRYVTDRKITFASIFIGRMPHFTPSKIKRPAEIVSNGGTNSKKQSTLNKYITKEIDGGENNNKSNATEMARREKQLRDQKAKTLIEEMERIRQEKQQRIAEQEKQRQEARIKLLARVEKECTALLTRTDDLERTDQRILPKFIPIKTYLAPKLLGDAFMLREFMHSFSGILSSMEGFRGNLNFYEMTRAFSVREVTGPLADITCILLNTILDQQREEEEECFVEYAASHQKTGLTELQRTQLNANRTQYYSKRHFSSRINSLPVDTWTLSEVLRLHLLGSGALVRDRAERWRFTYRNNYTSSEDPGLVLRQQHPHILRALRMYAFYQLPFVDVLRVLRCLMAQILTYSTPLNLIEKRMETASRNRIDLRNMISAENVRLSGVQTQRRGLMNEHNQACMTDEVRQNAILKQQLEDKLSKRLDDLNAQSEREHRKHEVALEKLKTSIFNYVVYLGADRAYRRYYVLESMPGIFIEHPTDCMDTCLVEPPTNALSNSKLAVTFNLPRNRRDLRAHLLKLYTDEAKRIAQADRQQQIGLLKNSANIASQDNKENQENQQEVKTNLTNGHDVETPADSRIADEESIQSAEASNNVTESSPTQYDLFMCTGDPRHCIVHDDRNPDRHRWAYLYEKDDIEELIEALNPLGEREGPLREQLTTLRVLILQHVRKCPFEVLTVEGDKVIARFKATMMATQRGKYDKTNNGSREGVDLNEVMQLSLIERIMQLEYDIYTGNLGQLNVKNMDKWRKDLLAGKFDAQAKLQWGPTQMNGDIIVGGEPATDDDADGYIEEDFGDVASSNGDINEFSGSKLVRFFDPGESLGNTLEIDSEDSADEGISLHDSTTLRTSVRQLASALLQVEQSIQPRFFKEPFGAPIKEVKNNKNSLHQQISRGVVRLKQWELSLMESVSYSQVFLHLSILDDAIVWSRSTNKSFCQVCRRGSDPGKMLLCDECNGGTHMFCMKPKMKVVPEGNWYCMKCVKRLGLQNETDRVSRQQQRAERVRRRQRSTATGLNKHGIERLLEDAVQISNDQEGDGELENDGSDNGEDAEIDEDDEESTGVANILVCAEDTEAEDEEDVGNVEQHSEEDGEEETHSEEEANEEEIEESEVNCNLDDSTTEENGEDNICTVCAYDGGDLMCVMCKDCYHLECIHLKRPPRYNFVCPKCKAPKEERKRRTRAEDNSDDDNNDDDDTTSSEPATKRPRSSRTSLRSSLQAASSPNQPETQRRSNRRAAETLDKVSSGSLCSSTGTKLALRMHDG